MSPKVLTKDLALTAPAGPDFFQQVKIVIAYFHTPPIFKKKKKKEKEE